MTPDTDTIIGVMITVGVVALYIRWRSAWERKR